MSVESNPTSVLICHIWRITTLTCQGCKCPLALPSLASAPSPPTCTLIFFSRRRQSTPQYGVQKVTFLYTVEITPTEVDLKGVDLVVGHVKKEKSKGGIVEIYHKITIQHCVAF